MAVPAGIGGAGSAGSIASAVEQPINVITQIMVKREMVMKCNFFKDMFYLVYSFLCWT